MPDLPVEIFIAGITLSGRAFRPSDWTERLCGCLSLFGEDSRINYRTYVKPVLSAGVKGLVIDCRLKEISPDAFEFLVSFAKDNELRLREGRREIRRGTRLQARAA